MEVISNEHQPPRYAQVVQSSTTTTNLASPTTNLSISSRHEEPPPSYDTVIVQLARGLDGSCTTNIIRWWKKLSESCIIFVWSHMYFIYLQNIIIYLGSNIFMYVLQYSQWRRTYGCSGCTCTHSFPAPPRNYLHKCTPFSAPPRSCTYTCTHAI